MSVNLVSEVSTVYCCGTLVIANSIADKALFYMYCCILPFAEKNLSKSTYLLSEARTRNSATAEIARDADVGAHAQPIDIREVYNLRTLKSSTSIRFTYMHYLFIVTSVYLLAYSLQLHIVIPRFSRWN